MKIQYYTSFLVVILFLLSSCGFKNNTSQEIAINKKNTIDIIAYYSGNGEDIKKYPIEKLDQIIYSFLHLKGNQLAIDDEKDSVSLLKITGLKKQHPHLKVLVSLGGWGGCKTCSEVFKSEVNRKAFAASVLSILKKYDADGIDLDWEYPAISGFPGHPYSPEDKQSFTSLIEELRITMGDTYELSFAAGGFDRFLVESVEWNKIMPLLNRVNVMSYDLVGGYSKTTGHHTALYPNPMQERSAVRAVQYLDSIGVPLDKIVIGAAFYGRVWENVSHQNHGLYQSGNFLKGIGYPEIEDMLSEEKNGFQIYWDTVSMAPYAYSSVLGQFVTYDDPKSIASKVQFVKDKKLGGIMFWELANDKPKKGLLDAIHQAVHSTEK